MRGGTDTRVLNPGPEYRQTVSISAQSIVAARNDLRSSLDAIGSRLDSHIDELQAELAPNPDPERLVTILEVLRQKWPAKQSDLRHISRRSISFRSAVICPSQRGWWLGL